MGALGQPGALGPRSPEPAPTATRRRWLIGGIAAVVLVGVGIALAVTLGGSGDPGAAETRTTVLASPTPTVAPAAREPGSAFLTALPSTVLQYAWSAVTPDAEWSAAGAVEAYDVTYTDGGTAQVTVRAGQWATADEVTATHEKVVTALTGAVGAAATPAATTDATGTPETAAVTQGNVTVAGAVVGSWTIVPGGGGSGAVVWSNGTTLFEATGPTSELANLYAAFPL